MDNYLEEDDIDFKKDIKERIKKVKSEIIDIENELEKLYELDTTQNIKKREIEDYIYYISSL
jgi:ribonucleotide reductase beta subunit family protein with ferritin-like domain